MLFDPLRNDSKDIVYYYNTVFHAHPHTIIGTVISQHDLTNRSHHHWRKELSAGGENYTAVNDGL